MSRIPICVYNRYDHARRTIAASFRPRSIARYHHVRPGDPSRDLLFGLLALQNGLIDQAALFAAFAAWTRDKGRPLADHLVDLGHLDARAAPSSRPSPACMSRHGGDPGKSLAVLSGRPLDSREPRRSRRP